MAYAISILVVVLLALLLVRAALSRQHRELTPKLPDAPVRLSSEAQLIKLKSQGNFRGIKVESHCRSSSQYAGTEFAFDDAPPLPVAGCDLAVCQCGYVGLPERRKQVDRRAGRERRLSIRMEANDRRADRPRRRSDESNWAHYGHL